MYEAYYGLSERPFNLTPDPRYLYLSNKHKEAFAHLMYGIRNNSGFVMVSGEIGTGKTTICRSLLKQLDPDTEVAFIFNPYLSPIELLQKVNHDFGVDSKADSVRELIDELNEYLLAQAADNKRCILIIDEAQNLSTELLEQIRLLSNLETETLKLLQIILIGQPELAQNLELYEMRQLNQRITARYHLEKLNEEETLHYIAFRIRVAGGNEKLKFTRKAIREVYKISTGTPRVINALCDRALLVGFTKELEEITPKVIRIAAKEIHGVEHVHKTPVNTGRFLRNAAVAVIAALIAVGIMYNYNTSFPEWVNQQVARFVPPEDPASDEKQISPSKNQAEAVSKPEVLLIDQPNLIEEGKVETEITIEEAIDEIEEMRIVAVETIEISEESEDAVLAKSNRLIEIPEMELPIEEATEPAVVFDSLAALRFSCSTLLKTWNLAELGSAPNADTVASVRSYARSNGMAATYLKPTVDELVRINVPALIRVDVGEGAYWASLTSIADGNAQFTAFDGTEKIETVADLDSAYLREAIVWWVDPKDPVEPLRAATQNDEVVQLQMTLQKLGLKENDPTGIYDGSTIETVSKIQRVTGLITDGIYGEQTQMVLSLWQDDPQTPHLSLPGLSEEVIQLIKRSRGLVVTKSEVETIPDDLPQWDELSAVINDEQKPDAGLVEDTGKDMDEGSSEPLPVHTYKPILPVNNGPSADSVTRSLPRSGPLVPLKSAPDEKGNRP
jgi:general secretion pathway protein A